MSIKHLAGNLYFLRKNAGYSQTDMLDLLGVQPTTWSNYENKRSEPPLDKIIEISNVFGVSVGDLLTVDLSTNVHLIQKNKGDGKVPKATPNSQNPVDYPIEENNNFQVQEREESIMWLVLKELKAMRQEINEMHASIEKKEK